MEICFPSTSAPFTSPGSDGDMKLGPLVSSPQLQLPYLEMWDVTDDGSPRNGRRSQSSSNRRQ